MSRDEVWLVLEAQPLGTFAWGRCDCCTFASGAFNQLWGIDPMKPLRGQYHDEAGARALIKSLDGWHRMTIALAKQAGLRRGTGDAGEIGLLATSRGPALGIGVGAGQWAHRVDGGIATTSDCIRSWVAPEVSNA